MSEQSPVYGTLSQLALPLEVKNGGRGAIAAYAPCELTDTYFRDGRIVSKVGPIEHFGWRGDVFLNGPKPIEPGEFGAVQTGRFQLGIVNAEDGIAAVGEHWGPVEDGDTLRKYVPGARVLQVFEGTDRVLLVRTEPAIVTCELTAQLDAGSTVDAALMRFDEDDEDLVVVSGITYQVRERTGLLTIESEARCFTAWLDQFAAWVVIGFACP